MIYPDSTFVMTNLFIPLVLPWLLVFQVQGEVNELIVPYEHWASAVNVYGFNVVNYQNEIVSMSQYQ